MTFEYRLTVRGYELDSFNHVNNAVYLNYFEQARWAILEELNLTKRFQEQNLFLVVTEVNIRYKNEAKLFDKLLIKTTPVRKNPYMIFEQSIYNENTGIKITQGKVTTLLIDKDRIPHDIPEDLLK